MDLRHLAFKQLQQNDGTWDVFCDDWNRQCAAFDDDLESYGEGWLQVLRDLAADANAESRKAGIFALIDAQGFHWAVCQVNCAAIKGYDGPVIRVRHIILCPHIDYGEADITTYGSVLAGVFAEVYARSGRQWPAGHIKFHLRSPEDQKFFGLLSTALAGTDRFSSVSMKGAWLYVTK